LNVLIFYIKIFMVIKYFLQSFNPCNTSLNCHYPSIMSQNQFFNGSHKLAMSVYLHCCFCIWSNHSKKKIFDYIKNTIYFWWTHYNSRLKHDFAEAASSCFSSNSVLVNNAIHLHCSREQCKWIPLFTQNNEQCNLLALFT